MEGLSNLGIDLKSILFYIINIGFLIVVLWYFLYDPILKVLSNRQKTISDTIDEANKLKTQFEKEMVEMERKQQAAQAELKSELEKMEQFIEKRKAQLNAEMEEERAKMLEKTSKEIEKRKAELISATEKQLLEVIKKIILEIVHNKVPANVIQESVNDAWQRYNK
jgi:F-type H+-transporting ATPase subunit b